MKRIVALALALLLTLSALILPAAAETLKTAKCGALLMLNMTEEEMSNYRKARFLIDRQLGKEGLNTSLFHEALGKNVGVLENYDIIYFDSLDTMLMSLNAGEINALEIYQTTADYLTHQNPELVEGITYDIGDDAGFFAQAVKNGSLSNDFAFMMMESNTSLRDEFNEALASITEDEMNQLIQDYITAAINDGTVTPVTMPVIDDAETIKVAVTGSLPPMDYVAADGSPAGFNTALLAEISKRINKNIELVVVDSVGRAAALASGTVDAVFWTRTNRRANEVAEMSEEERSSFIDNEQLTDAERETLRQVRELFDFSTYGKADMPEGTIITMPYYSDLIVPVTTKATLESIKDQAGN
jgi:ABC-type amino acid transport substrate-binding protein